MDIRHRGDGTARRLPGAPGKSLGFNRPWRALALASWINATLRLFMFKEVLTFPDDDTVTSRARDSTERCVFNIGCWANYSLTRPGNICVQHR